ncbi:hypothetical protein I3260_18720 [Photobacterium damselae]|uniref:hypothetical protein n=1 Tax=Gammaproteobacteria TaxID=1236 RepID=UPI001EE0F9F6|nr:MULTISPECIES: hypothetical protein [Gammaproteobacteria]MCG3814271.1 hypothetical protein [Photobacterium damselae]MCG3880382.1 hypothetical protein [Psychrobacter sp. Ps6]
MPEITQCQLIVKDKVYPLPLDNTQLSSLLGLIQGNFPLIESLLDKAALISTKPDFSAEYYADRVADYAEVPLPEFKTNSEIWAFINMYGPEF